jgi:hypothetical protein
MKREFGFMSAVLVIAFCLSAHAVRGSDSSSTSQPAVGSVAFGSNGQDANQTDATNQPIRKIDFNAVEKENEERLRHPHPSDWPFPNFQTGPGRPLPNYVNFYRIDDRFPSYLLCEYDVNATPYDPSKEIGWFRSALEQVRRSGPTKFPPIKWIAVTIRNVAEHKDATAFAGSFKVGAIFNSSEVFDVSFSLKALIARAAMDRHPFTYDPSHPLDGEDQRWLIVERHAAVNAAPSPK